MPFLNLNWPSLCAAGLQPALDTDIIWYITNDVDVSRTVTISATSRVKTEDCVDALVFKASQTQEQETWFAWLQHLFLQSSSGDVFFVSYLKVQLRLFKSYWCVGELAFILALHHNLAVEWQNMQIKKRKTSGDGRTYFPVEWFEAARWKSANWRPFWLQDTRRVGRCALTLWQRQGRCSNTPTTTSGSRTRNEHMRQFEAHKYKWNLWVELTFFGAEE
jgi:hypothetical protein